MMFNSLFGFMFERPYGDRCIGRLEVSPDVFVSTASVSDGSLPYETAVQHPAYNNANMVIVEAYATREEAEIGHERWCHQVSHEPMPFCLLDCNNSEIQQFVAALDPDNLIHYRTDVLMVGSK